MKKTIVSLSFTFLFAMAMCIIVGLGVFNVDTRKKLDEAKANTVEDADFSEKVSNGAFSGGIAGWGYENGRRFQLWLRRGFSVGGRHRFVQNGRRGRQGDGLFQNRRDVAIWSYLSL